MFLKTLPLAAVLVAGLSTTVQAEPAFHLRCVYTTVDSPTQKFEQFYTVIPSSNVVINRTKAVQHDAEMMAVYGDGQKVFDDYILFTEISNKGGVWNTEINRWTGAVDRVRTESRPYKRILVASGTCDRVQQFVTGERRF